MSAALLTRCLPADPCCSASESRIPNRCLARYYCTYFIWHRLTDDTISSTPSRECLFLIHFPVTQRIISASSSSSIYLCTVVMLGFGSVLALTHSHSLKMGWFLFWALKCSELRQTSRELLVSDSFSPASDTGDCSSLFMAQI